jgi:hypothetical protein
MDNLLDGLRRPHDGKYRLVVDPPTFLLTKPRTPLSPEHIAT